MIFLKQEDENGRKKVAKKNYDQIYSFKYLLLSSYSYSVRNIAGVKDDLVTNQRFGWNER